MIEAAGGLLWRRGPEGATAEIAVVHRSRYDDWALPKGKLIPGESVLAAAIREVREETGYKATALGFAGAIAYETRQGLKLVCFWNMAPQDDGGQALDESEVIEVVWLHPQQALDRLSYPLERAILTVWKRDLEFHQTMVAIRRHRLPKPENRASQY